MAIYGEWMLGFVPNSFADFGNNKIVFFLKIVVWHSRFKLWLKIFYFMEIILFSYFWLKILFNFGKITLDGQDTYLGLGLLLGTYRASI